MKKLTYILSAFALFSLFIVACNKTANDPVKDSRFDLVAPNDAFILADSEADLKQMILTEIDGNYTGTVQVTIDKVGYETYEELTFANVYYTLSNGFTANVIFYPDLSATTASERAARPPVRAASCDGKCDNSIGCIISFDNGLGSYQCKCLDGSHDNCTIKANNATAKCKGTCGGEGDHGCIPSYSPGHNSHFCWCANGAHDKCELDVN